MNRRDFLLLFLIGLVLPSTTAIFQLSPGYMDAEYYFADGVEIASGKGFTESFLWNYLDSPESVPRPSHAYWMPLASLIAAAGMVVTRSLSFSAGRILFILLAATIPVATTALCWELCQSRRKALLAGVLAALPGFYLPYLATTDTFPVYMLLGAAWSMLAGRAAFNKGSEKVRRYLFGMGMISGLLHMARADGILWLLLSGLFVLAEFKNERNRWPTNLALAAVGYALVMGPWLVRNQVVLGAPLSPASSRLLWLTDYDDLYIYPPEQLTAERWLASGLENILESRLWALGQNLQSALAVQGSIFLAPLMLAGIWKYRKDVRIRCGVSAGLLLLVMMSAIFPFAGARGGFFHGGAALQPLLWAVVPAGLEQFLGWGRSRRGWNLDRAGRVFGFGLLLFALLLTGYISAARLGKGGHSESWNGSFLRYQKIEGELIRLGASPEDIVLINNPPGYYVASGRMGIAIPDGGLEELLAAAKRYRARYLILEPNHPQGLEDLYLTPGDRPGLSYLQTFDDPQSYHDPQIYRIDP